MKAFHRAAVALLSLWLASFGLAHAEGRDTHHAHAPAQLTLNQGAKWATDEPLRTGMDSLRILFAKYLPTIRKQTLTDDDYKILGEVVQGEVGRIVAQCKLPPQADAMLHLVIADLLAGADLMTGKTPGKPVTGAQAVVTALNSYGSHFEHAGWLPLK